MNAQVPGWHTRRLLCLDFETTGVDPFRDRIVTAAAIAVGNGQPNAAQEWLIDPVIEIAPAATEVHGISTERARAEGAEAGPAVLEIGIELIRHGHTDVANVLVDLALVVDTQIIEKHLDPYRPKEPKPWTKRPTDACGSHQLVECCRLWGIELSEEDAHGAAADALAAGRLAWRLATNPTRFAQFDRGPGTPRIDPAGMSLRDLHAWQITEYARSAVSYQSYKRGEQRSKPDVVDPEFVAATRWPIQEPPADWSPEQLPVVPEPVHA